MSARIPKNTKLSYIFHILNQNDDIVYVGHLYQIPLLDPLEQTPQFAHIIRKLPISIYTVKITHRLLITDELALSTFKYLKIKKLEKKELYQHLTL